MKIQDDTKGIQIDIKTSLVSTHFEVSYTEMAAIIGSFEARNEITDENFIDTFLKK